MSILSDETKITKRLVNDLKTGLTYDDFEDKYGMSSDVARGVLDDMREHGFAIDFDEVNEYGKRMFYIPDDVDKSYRFGDGDGEYKFAIISDTHLGSAATHEDELNNFYDRLVDEGIDTVFHAGDISDGYEVHAGQINGLKPEAIGWGRLEDYVVENYPERDGVHTFFIEGNHDHKLHRRTGKRFADGIDLRRDDLHYLGDSLATIVFDEENDIDLELIHPDGGQPYTKGYRIQTLYRERPLENRPTIAAIGHLHGSMFAEAEGVKGLYAGAWKGLTTYGKRKGHSASIGGWIIDMSVEDGSVREFVPRWVGYEARDDRNEVSMDDINRFLDGDGDV